MLFELFQFSGEVLFVLGLLLEHVLEVVDEG